MPFDTIHATFGLAYMPFGIPYLPMLSYHSDLAYTTFSVSEICHANTQSIWTAGYFNMSLANTHYL
jgi:hypothetical protein